MFYDVVRGMFEILSKEIDNFTGDSVLINEEKMKKEESILFQFGKIHAILTERHEHGKDLSKEPKHIQYEKLQKVKLVLNHLKIFNSKLLIHF